MSERTTVLQQVLLAPEATSGTRADCTIKIGSANCQFRPQADFTEHRAMGDKLPSRFLLTKEMADGSLDGKPSYNETGWWLSSICGKPITTELVAPSGDDPGVYQHLFPWNSRGYDDPNTFTMEYGDGVRAHRVLYALLTDFNLKLTRSDASVSGTFIGRRLDDGIDLTAGEDEVQTITIGASTGFSIGYKGAFSDNLVVADTDASDLQAALQALPTVGAGNLLVSGSGPYLVTGAGDFAGLPLTLLEFSGLGTLPTVVRTTRGGYTEVDLAPIMPAHFTAYYADTLAGLEAGQLQRGFVFDWKIGGKYKPIWAVVGSEDFAGHAEGPASIDTTLTVEADADGMALLADARTGALRYFWIKALGLEIGDTSYANSLSIKQAVRVKSLGNFGDQDDVYAYEFGLGCVFDPVWGQAMQIELVNEVASYEAD